MSGVQPALDRQRSERRARWSTAIVGLSGLAGIALCDGLEGQMGVFALAICGFGWAMPRVLLTQFFKWVSPFVAVALIVSPVVFGMDWVSAGIALVLYLQIFKSWTAVTARDHRVCLLLALLMALLASTLTQSVFFALSLIVVAMVTPVALLQLHLWQMEEHKPHRPEMVTSRGRTWPSF
jgi:drug/metabolite transporter (DMT)-like permease